ncbi:hypothetical protein RND81_09G260300 [Saponaria officinalis]|uniref:Uncharacterized protein n=1 Tax=Saponaria officinalis TaxID=3572 RepID=A0AAW1IR90_SAPOF
MEEDEHIFTPSNFITFSQIQPASTNPRRLSSRFSKPSSPVKAGPTKLAWVSLQGRLVGAEEATSARAIDGGLSRDEAVAWELFSPIHRVLIVAVVAVAAAKCEKNRQISQLKNCVELRDRILMSMQQKLDNLCEQMNCIKDQPQPVADSSAHKTMDCSSSEASFPCNSDSISTDCWLCDQHRAQLNDLSGGNSFVKAASMDEMFRSRLSVSNEAEQEERRMSDLSDWAASSVTSAADMQLNNLAVEQDTYNLKKECEEKDAAIKELSAFIRSKDAATSKRIEDLEEIIRRKNTIISKLRKDMIVLEQKVMSLTRMRRRSYSGPETAKKQLPIMMDNLIYDMDSPTSPMSSDSDSSSEKQSISSVKTGEVNSVSTPVHMSFTCENANVTKRHRQSAPPKIPSVSSKPSPQIPRSRQVSPLTEKSMNQRHNAVASPRVNETSASVGSRNSRRRTQNASKETASSKRWM